MQDYEQAANLLSLMGNEARLRVFGLISEREWDVGSLAAEVNLSQSALSQHLKKMRDLKVVQVRREAQTIYYSCNSEAVFAVMATLEDIYSESRKLQSAA